MTDHVMPTYARSDLRFDRGEGPWLFTPEGDRYLDFGSGIAVNALGHSHPKLTEALTEQAGKLWHTSNLYTIDGQKNLSDILCGNSFADLVFFTNSGAEACECAIKTARKYHSATQAEGETPRWRIITFEGAFHGRTLATISAGKQAKHVDGFGPLVDGFDQVPLNDVKALKDAITDETAAIMLEPIQGEGGIREADLSFMRAIRDLCDQHGLLMIVDEVQTGIGRTGKLFAYEWAGIEPDIMALAKGIGGGFPLGACLATEKAAQGMQAGSHGSTYGGNQLAMAVGEAVMEEVTAPGFIDNVQKLATLFKQKLAGLADSYPDIIEGVRGQGLLLGLECKIDAADLIGALRDQKMLTVGAGENVVRLLPPLNIEEEVLDQALEALETACASLNQNKTGGS